LGGWDRLVVRGELRVLYAENGGMNQFLKSNKILFKDFGKFLDQTTRRLRAASMAAALELNRPVLYVRSPKSSKEEIAREIARRDDISEGLICVLKCVEPCMSFSMAPNGKTKELDLKLEQRQCLHLYHYWMHPVFGFMHGRIQTWFPFRMQMCLNGREWLGRQMDVAGLQYYQECCAVTINDEEQFWVLRPKEGGPEDELSWRRMRRGIADPYRRAEVSREATERYLDALAGVDESTRMQDLTEPVEQAVRWHKGRVRGLRLFHPEDGKLLAAVGQAEFVINGFRNRDLQRILLGGASEDVQQRRRQAAAIGRKIRMLRAHRLIRKITRTHRYCLTERGRQLIDILQTAKAVSTRQLIQIAA
jgi:hypothetical protein